MTIPKGIWGKRARKRPPDWRTTSFWSRVDKTPGHGPNGNCWVWTKKKDISGYGLVRRYKSLKLTHRISWEERNGPIPFGIEVCHHCDNPPCVRPDHLFVGTHKENMQDCLAKGRHRSQR